MKKNLYLLFLLLLMLLSSQTYAYTVNLPDPLFVPGKGQLSQEIILQNTSSTEYIAVELVAKKRETDEKLEEVLSDTEDIIIFPNQIVLEPNSTQISNIQWVNQDPVEKEKAYRVVTTQLELDDGSNRQIQVNTLLSYSKPLYVRPLSAAPYFEIESLEKKDFESEDHLYFTVKNAGTMNGRVENFKIQFPGPNGNNISTHILLKDCLPFKSTLRLFPDKEVSLHIPWPIEVPKSLISKLKVIDFNSLEEENESN